MRKLVALFLTITCCGVAYATSRSSTAPAIAIIDLYEAWPATERFSDGPLERICAMPSAVAGRVAARRDIAAGVLRVKVWGGGYPLRTVSKLLGQRGIQTCRVAGCIVSQPKLASWISYDDVMIAEIERRHGRDFLDDVWRAADAEQTSKQ